jgi:DNA segregation ATPase FtsK/SpoIIIE, S-DNA-T family
VQELPDVVTALVAMAQRGRSLGVHLVLATQRPAGVVRDDIRANTELRVCLRVADRADAMEVIGDAQPATFERSRPGRALLRRGGGEVEEVQVANTSDPWPPPGPPVRLTSVGADISAPTVDPEASSTLATVVSVLAEAARTAELDPPAVLWQPPLPTVLQHAPEPDALGVLDDVTRQQWLPLRCDPLGHVVVIGGPVSGVTHTLGRIVAARTGHDVVAVGDHHGCATVMDDLLAALDRRRDGASPTTPLTVVVDGVGAMRRRWEHDLGSAAWRAASMWERLLSDGPALGVTVVAGADRVASCGGTLLAVAATRWLLRPLDPLDAALLGVRVHHDDMRHWPPGRLVDAATGLVGQVAFNTPSTMCTVRSA